MPIEWRPEFSVGDPGVDYEHRQLVDLVNVAAADILDNRPEADVERALGDLLRAVTAHFAHEEHQMRAAGYDQLHDHKDDHERLIDSLRDIMDDRDIAAPAAAERLTRVLEDWFTGHFSTHDARLHKVLGPHEH
ncbi:MAG: hemerythrin family protein [Rubellimicrobium sp.]|nr:hemerythrin family protein [Rubellimicrobium sp.]